MGTRSIIAREKDGMVAAIYCHWDGYPSNNGKILRDHYQDDDKVEALIGLGSLSALKPMVAPVDGMAHTFDRPAEDVTIAYHRDRGEDLQPAEVFPAEEFKRSPVNHGTEYWYLRAGGRWLCKCGNRGQWIDIDEAVQRDS